MKTFEDCNGILLKDGDIFDVHQSINGCNTFVIVNLELCAVYYFYDNCIQMLYEYDTLDLLDIEELEIIGNIK